MLKRFLLLTFCLIIAISAAPFALADTDCDASASHYARAVQLHDMGDYARALRHYNCALAAAPDNPTIPLLIENLHEDIASAPHAWSAAAPAQPGFVMPDWLTPYEVVPAADQAASAPSQPIQVFRQYARLSIQLSPLPESRAAGLGFADYIEFANWFSKRGDWQRAAKSLERALQLQPHHADLRCRLGEVYQALGDESAALAQFDQVVFSRDPSNICANDNRRAVLRAAYAELERPMPAPQAASPAQPIVERALRYRAANKLFAAANTLIEALALDAAHSQARCELAMIYRDWSNYGRALREFERILAHQPADDCASGGRLATIEKMLSMYVPLVVDDYFYHAREYLRIEAWPQARAALERGLALAPMHSYMRCQLGMVALQLGDTRFALAQFDRILASDSLDACALSNRDALMQRLREE